MTRIMIIRHGEKPCEQGIVRGVSIHGEHDKHDLSVHGWQRAGALVRFFAPLGGFPEGSPISSPQTIIAAAATHKSPSLRALHTVRPLAAMLGLHVHAHYANGEEADVAAKAVAARSPVLIAWHHSHIPRLVKETSGSAVECPAVWPDDRFDLVWILDRCEDSQSWRFTQHPQNVLAEDCPDPA